MTDPKPPAPEQLIEIARKRWPEAVRFWVDEERQTWFENGEFRKTTSCKLWALPKDMLDGHGRAIALLYAPDLAGLIEQVSRPTNREGAQ